MPSKERPWIDLAVLMIVLVTGAAALITYATRDRDVATFSTGNDRAPLCADRSPGSRGGCVTQKNGTVESFGYQSCSTPAPPTYGGCTALPLNVSFADGSRRRFEFGGDRDEVLIRLRAPHVSSAGSEAGIWWGWSSRPQGPRSLATAT